MDTLRYPTLDPLTELVPIQIRGADMWQQLQVTQGALGSYEYLQSIQLESDVLLRNREVLDLAPLIHLSQRFRIRTSDSDCFYCRYSQLPRAS